MRPMIRRLLKTPSFTVSAVLLLGLGVGSVTTIFTLVDHTLLRSLPYPEADRLFVIENGTHSGTDWRYFEAMPSVDALVAQSSSEVNLTGGDEAVSLVQAQVTERYFEVFGAGALLGRMLEPEDWKTDDAVVLSHASWMRIFYGDSSVVGRTVRIDGAPLLVVGVADADYIAPMAETWSSPEVWRPQTFADPLFEQPGYQVLSVIGRVRPGATLTDAASDARSVSERRARDFPDRYRRDDGRVLELPVRSLQDSVTGDLRQGLELLLAAVLLLLLIACANVAHLFLARGVARRREMAVRRALGAGSAALSRQLLAESLFIALGGAALGTALAAISLNLFLSLEPQSVLRTQEIGIDPRTLGFALAVSVVTTLTFGMAPAFRLARRDKLDALRIGGPGAGVEPRSRAMRSGLVIAEVALCVVLVTQAGLLFESFVRLHEEPLGFRVNGVWTLPVRLPGDGNVAGAVQRLERIRERLAAVPGVAAASFGYSVPMEHVNGDRCCWGANLEGPEGGVLRATMHPVATDWFTIFETPLVSGRFWEDHEVVPGILPAVVNEAFARAMFGSPAAALGREVMVSRLNVRIGGVVETDRHYGPGHEHGPAVYLPAAAAPVFSDAHFAVLAPSASAGIAAALRQAVWDVEPDLPVRAVRPMTEWMEQATAAPRFRSFLFSSFGTVALLLAAGGLYGTMLFTVGTRRQEFGIRLALGARPSRIEASVLAHGLGLALVGTLLGAVGARASGGLLEAWLFEVESSDAGTLAAGAMVLLGTAALASWLPARRAAATNPLETLREG